MNINRNLVAATALAIGIASAMPAIAETDTTVTTIQKTTNHHYVYYGDHQIYFAPETKTYYWQVNSAGPWQSGATLPVESQAFVRTGGVEMDLDTEQPYERHEWVVGHYKHLHDRDNQEDHEKH